MTHPQPGVSLTRSTSSEGSGATAASASEQFDPSTWQVPTGVAGWNYLLKRSFSKKYSNNHADHLLWQEYMADCEAAHEEWQQECDMLRQELAVRNAAAERAYNQVLVKKIMNLGVLPTVVGGNWKSGGKTTLLAYVGALMSKLSGRNCLLLPATANTKTATSGKITGLSGGLTMLEYERDLPSFTTAKLLFGRLATTSDGLAVVVEDQDDNVKGKKFDSARFYPVMRNAYQMATGCLMIDPGNDNWLELDIPLTATQAAEVIVFTATNTAPGSHDTMINCLKTLRTDTYNGVGDDVDGRMPGEFRSTADKIRHAVVVINGVKPDDAPYDFDKLRTDGAYNVKESAPVQWEGEGCIVPYNSFIHGGHNKLNIVDLEAIDTATYDAYLAVALAILTEGARAMGISLDELPVFTPEEFEAPPEPQLPEPDYASNRSA